MFNIVKIFTDKTAKIARENLTIEGADGQPHEWRKLVGSIRRRVQRHASNIQQEPGTSKAQTPSPTFARKNSLTQSTRFDFFKREKSRDDPVEAAKPQGKAEKEKAQKTLVKQKSIEGKCELFKGLSFKDKSKSVSVKSVCTISSPTGGKACIKKTNSDRVKDSEKKRTGAMPKVKSPQKEEKNRDDFLKATMRIFLVVSPPVGKIQVNKIIFATKIFENNRL